MNIEKKGILNKREYLGPVWPADVWPANDIPFCSIFTFFQYSLIHDLALIVLLQKHFRFLNYCLIYTVLSFSRYTMRNCIIARTLFHKKIRVTWYMILKVVIICLSKLLLFFKLTRWQRQKFRFRDRSQCCCCWGSRRLRRRRFWSYWGTVQRVAVAWRNGM